MGMYKFAMVVIQLKETMTASVVLAAIVLLAVVVYVLILRGYPRTFWIGHSIDLEGYMKMWITEFRQRLTLLQTDPTVTAKMKTAIANASRLTDDDLIFFFQFYDYHTLRARELVYKKGETPPQKWWYTDAEMYLIPKLAPVSIRTKAGWFTEGTLNPAPFNTYVQDEMNRVRELAHEVKVHLETKKAALSVVDAHIFRLDLLLNQYRKDIVQMHNMRKTHGFTMQFNIFRQYLGEYTETIIMKRILRETWSEFAQTVNDFEYTMASWYQNKRREWMQKAWQIPMRLLDGKVEEPFQVEEKEETEQPPPVIEEFNPKKLFKTIGNIGKFFKQLFKIIPKVFMIIIKLVKLLKDPKTFLIKLIGFLVGLVIYIVFLVLDALRGLIVLILAYLAALAWSVLYTALWITVYTIVLVIFFVLWVLDMCTGGKVLQLLRCENAPSAWIDQPNFAFGNTFVRSFLCVRPCNSGYGPKKSAMVCTRAESYEPQLCPQQVVHTGFTHRDDDSYSLKAPHLYEFKPSPEFWLKTNREKRAVLKKFHKERKAFMLTCHKTYEPYEGYTKLMCANLDAYIDKAKHPDLYRQTKGACAQMYCQFQVNKQGRRYELALRTKDQMEPFCKMEDEIVEEPIPDEVDIVTKVAFVAMCTAIALVTIYSFVLVMRRRRQSSLQ
jgi:ABC-type multidrug transport system fused ATPase/permease subunit